MSKERQEPWVELQDVATALRDLSLSAALFEQNPSATHRQSLNYRNDYAEALLERFISLYGDIRSSYHDDLP